jgi:hypothetical protein
MSQHQMTLDEFIKAFAKIKSQGWVKSERHGSTGIGQTLEKLLGISENNIASPDLGEIELKAHRINSSSMITLFTFNRRVWKMKPLDAIKKYGSPDENGRLGIYYTMSKNPNSKGVYLQIKDDIVSVQHISGEVIAEWHIDALVERFMNKIPAMIYVNAQSKIEENKEWFKFETAKLLSSTSERVIREQINQGNILLDLRLHQKTTSARNHGTAFRVYEEKLPLLFETIVDL